MRISPKISEKPAESRNSRPPNVTLLTVSSSQKLICAVLPISRLPLDVYRLAAIAPRVNPGLVIRHPSGTMTSSRQHFVSGG